jgi:hypothetical protein
MESKDFGKAEAYSIYTPAQLRMMLLESLLIAGYCKTDKEIVRAMDHTQLGQSGKPKKKSEYQGLYDRLETSSGYAQYFTIDWARGFVLLINMMVEHEIDLREIGRMVIDKWNIPED